jgi:Protein of unknown function (DUF2442)
VEREESGAKFWLAPVRLERSRGFNRPEIRQIERLVAERAILLLKHGMSISQTELREATARGLTISDDAISVDLEDGRTITAPLAWFPRLAHGTATERANWRLIAMEKESTGPTWMKTSAFKVCWRGEGLVKARVRSAGG